MKNRIEHKESDHRGMFYFEDESGIISELNYSIQENNILAIDHTETNKDAQGKGLATKLMKKSVEYARENNYKIDPLCEFAQEEFDKNKEYHDVLAE